MNAFAKHALVLTLAATTVMAGGWAGCANKREQPVAAVYEGDIDELLAQRCLECHGDDAAGGWSAESYSSAIACSDASPQRSVIAMDDGEAAILIEALRQDVHDDVLSDAELRRLQAWVAAGAPLRGLSLHEPGILDPQAERWHGKLARADGLARLRNPQHPQACGRCHAGAPVRPEGPLAQTDGATACTNCHDQPDGVLACSTCHGAGERPYPPRASCQFDVPGGAHTAHVEGGTLGLGLTLTCDDCHPSADARLLRTHGNGRVDVRITARLSGPDAEYDAEAGSCSVACHARGGARAEPSWLADEALSCGDCHGSPPEDHFAGPCDSCHIESNADGTALTATALHLNGRVDVGSGEAGCAACHGVGDDPWPATPSHQLHRDSALMTPIECAECHVVPERVTAEGHLDRDTRDAADVVFSGRALLRDASPIYQDGTCSEVACHGAGLRDEAQLVAAWDAPIATPEDQSCQRCHGAPPPPPHSTLDTCAATLCHGSETTLTPNGPDITSGGRALHIDGMLQAGR